jgi:hypothetical protein
MSSVMSEGGGLTCVCDRIYKPKYADEADERGGRGAKAGGEKKGREKSRSRGLFSRKKPNP